jgi:hypothetical protein
MSTEPPSLYPAQDYGVLGPLPGMDDLLAMGLYVAPYPTRRWSGGVTSDGFRVNYDVAGSVPAQFETVGLAVATDVAMQNIVYDAPQVAPTYTVGRVAAYYTGAFTVTGLDPDTYYYWAPRINGDVATSYVSRVKTAPTVGTAASFNFVVGSCTNSLYTMPDVYATVAAHEPAFFVHLGDMAYSDINIDDPGAQRDTNTRQWRSARGVQGMLTTVPVAYTPDDHDFGPDDSHWDQVNVTGATLEEIGANTRLVYRETTPAYDTWNDLVLGQQWDWGRCRFIMPDLRSQRRYEVGDPTFLGTGTNPPGSFNQRQAVLDAITQAETDGVKVLFFLSSSTWAPSVFDSWDRYNSTEQTLIADAFQSADVQVVLVHGDTHQLVIDDGTYTDRSSNQAAKLPLVCSSGMYLAAGLFSRITDAAWNGGTGIITDDTNENGNGHVKISVQDNGGSDIHFEIEFLGNPISGTTATQLGGGVFRDDDGTVEVGFSTNSALGIRTGLNAQVPVLKDWFGPVDGCSATYTWASGPTGTVAFTPNNNIAYVPRVYTTGVGDTCTLSAPSGCTLGAFTSRAIVYFTPEAETTAWLAALDATPDDETIYAMNTYIAGLKAAGIWTSLAAAWWLGAHTRESSKVNIKNPATYTLTESGTLSFAPGLGWIGGSTTGTNPAHLETGYAVPGANQNSHAMFMRVLNNESAFNGEMGGEQFYINPWSNTASDFRFRSASTTTDSLLNSVGTPGQFGFSRTGSANYKGFQNGAALATFTRTSAVPGATTAWLCAWQNATTPSQSQSGSRRCNFATIWSGLSDANVLIQYNLETAFLTSIGTL